MSTYYGLRKSIKADELFDGRLEALRERCARSGRSLSANSNSVDLFRPRE